MSDSTRSKAVEVMADAIHDASQQDDWISPTMAASVALTAYESHLEAEGMAVVPIAEIQFARDAVEDWAGYADDYYKKRHNLAGDLARIDATLAAAKPPQDDPDPPYTMKRSAL